MISLSDNNKVGVTESFNSTLIYLDDLLKVYVHGFEHFT